MSFFKIQKLQGNIKDKRKEMLAISKKAIQIGVSTPEEQKYNKLNREVTHYFKTIKNLEKANNN